MPDRPAPVHDRWYVLIVLTLTYAINIADRFSISTLIEPIREDLRLSNTEVGVLTGVALGIFYVLIGLPLATLADRANRQRILLSALAAWSVMTALCGLSRNYWQLFLARIGVGVGEAGGTPPSTSILADKFDARWRPLALSVFAVGAALGSWIGTSVVGRIADRFDWRTSFLALGVSGIVIALLVWLTIREPRRGQLDPTSRVQSAGFLETLRYVWAHPALVHFMIGAAILTFWGWGLMWWTPAFLGRSHRMSVGEAGATLGPIHLIAGTGSTLLAAWLMTHSRGADSRHVVRLVLWVTLVAVVPSIVAYATACRELSIAMLWVFVPAIYFWIGPLFGVLQNLVPPGMRAQACAVLLFVTNFANLIVAPPLIGILSDWFEAAFGTGDDSLRWVLALCAPSGFWAAWHLWRCGNLIRREVQGSNATGQASGDEVGYPAGSPAGAFDLTDCRRGVTLMLVWSPDKPSSREWTAMRTPLPAPVLGVAALSLLFAAHPQLHSADQVKRGLNLGDDVPVASMHAVVGEPKDRNTCFAGKFRKERTFSVYARTIEEPGLGKLLKKLDGLLAANKELRGYLLLASGSQSDGKLKDRLKEWAKEQGLTRIDIAITNTDPEKTYGLARDQGVVVVYSDKLRVKFRRDVTAGKLDEAALKELAVEMDRLGQ